MFSNASNFVQGVDKTFFIILGISFFFLILITFLMIFFVIKYNRKKNKAAVQIKDNIFLEITWITIPVILVCLMFYYGYAAYLPMRNAPKDAMQVTALARMWKWTFEYKGKKQSDNLVVPINKAVKINLVSQDVIHGFFIPDFRIKEDIVPGKDNYAWFIPQELGEYEIFCSAYCGIDHSYMASKVIVVTQAEFDKWLVSVKEKSTETNNEGLIILQKNGCLGCHSIDGSKIIGPTFKGFYGSTVEVIEDDNHKKIIADSTYIKVHIIKPDKYIVVGYQKGIMKSYKDILKDEDIRKITKYLETIKNK
ncbi:MAG: cytochrome c oxidase subunit II [Bacteroidales bacterium]|jgi:cytochrome c oxidase subunit 2